MEPDTIFLPPSGWFYIIYVLFSMMVQRSDLKNLTKRDQEPRTWLRVQGPYRRLLSAMTVCPVCSIWVMDGQSLFNINPAIDKLAWKTASGSKSHKDTCQSPETSPLKTLHQWASGLIPNVIWGKGVLLVYPAKRVLFFHVLYFSLSWKENLHDFVSYKGQYLSMNF